MRLKILIKIKINLIKNGLKTPSKIIYNLTSLVFIFSGMSS